MTELNQYLQPVNSPATQQQQTSGYDFYNTHESSSITNTMLQNASISNAKIGTAAIGTANIGTLSFNEISGGTATLGGTANGDGVVSVQNAGGTEIVQINNQGIRVTGGSITVINASGGTAIDGAGVVSLANFTGVNSVSSYTGTLLEEFTNGTAYTDVTGGSLQLILTRPANVLFMADGLFTMGVTGTTIEAREFFALTIGTTRAQEAIQTGRLISGVPYGEVSSFFSQSMHHYGSISEGTTDVKLQVRHADVLGAGSTHTRIWSYKLTYVILGS